MARRREPMTPRSIRTYDAQWAQATEAATWNNEDVSAAIRRFLDSYIETTNRARAKAEAEARASAPTV